jgi:hypothetical protein
MPQIQNIPDKLISYIERYNLDQYDNQVRCQLFRAESACGGIKTRIRTIASNGLASYVVQKGYFVFYFKKIKG